MAEQDFKVESIDEVLKHLGPLSDAETQVLEQLQSRPAPYQLRVHVSNRQVKWTLYWQAQVHLQRCEDSFWVVGASASFFWDREAREVVPCLFEKTMPYALTRVRVIEQLDAALGPLAVRLRLRSTAFKAGNDLYFIQEDGRIQYKDRLFSVEERLPVIAKQLEQGFPFVTRGQSPITTLLYVYQPTSNDRCPREDVIKHFQGLLDEKSYEHGAVDDYTQEQALFNSGSSWPGCHVCEGKDCGNPMSATVDLHLVHQGRPTYFVTNSLCVHYLTHHWSDAKKQLARINKYLAIVGIKEISHV